MPDLLVRDVSEETKRALAVRAAQNGRSLQAEAKAILTDAVALQRESWFSMMRRAFVDAELDGFAVPERHPARAREVW
ncbi:MAG: hypothetical protein IKD70_08970 [Eggerthellaceae bacterium]|nr:hypothetical protein [Eggerthellaceae bacterium]